MFGPYKMTNERQMATIILVILVIVAIVIIVVMMLMRNNGIQPFRRLNMPTGLSRTETVRKDIEEQPKAVETPKEQVETTPKTTPKRSPKHSKKSRTPKRSSKPEEPQLPLYTVDTHWDLFSTKEDTMKLYGVSQQELDKLVEQYRKDQKYEIEAAPTTLTFNLDKWERATDAMQDSMRNVVVQSKPYEDGLVDMLYKEGEYV